MIETATIIYLTIGAAFALFMLWAKPPSLPASTVVIGTAVSWLVWPLMATSIAMEVYRDIKSEKDDEYDY